MNETPKKRGRPALNRDLKMIRVPNDAYVLIKRMAEIEGRSIGETVRRMALYGQSK